jgi:hypothetical protein
MRAEPVAAIEHSRARPGHPRASARRAGSTRTAVFGRSGAPHVLNDDPGEPEYVEAVQLRFAGNRAAAWRFRDVVAAAA